MFLTTFSAEEMHNWTQFLKTPLITSIMFHFYGSFVLISFPSILSYSKQSVYASLKPSDLCVIGCRAIYDRTLKQNKDVLLYRYGGEIVFP